MLNKTLIVFWFSIVFTQFSYGQYADSVIRIKFSVVPVDSSVALTTGIMTPLKDTFNLKNIPPRHDLSSFRILILNDNRWIENYKNGRYIKDLWYDYSPSDDPSLPIRGKVFAVFTSLDTIHNIKYFVIDHNANQDFSDDSLMTQDMDNVSRYSPFEVSLDAGFEYSNGSVVNYPIPIKIYPSQNILFNGDTLSKKLGISIAFNKGLKGIYSDYDQPYKYVFKTGITHFGVYGGIGREIWLSTQNARGYIMDGKTFKIGDTLNIGYKTYYVDSFDISKNTLQLRFVDYQVYGNSLGRKLKDIKTTDFITKKAVDITDKGGNFILLDFWATWCLPCVKGIPKLKEIAEKNKDILRVVSFSVDDPKDTSLLRKMIRQYKMDWEQVWIHNKTLGSNNILKQLDIQGYPTFILLDPSLKIIYRESTINGLEGIERVLKNFH